MLHKVVALFLGLLGGLWVLIWVAGPREVGKAPSYIVSMRTDLRNLVTAQEAYFIDHERYFAGTLSSADSAGAVDNYFRPSEGVTITVGVGLDVDSGWRFSAGATHWAVNVTCAVYVGEPPRPPASVEGEPGCTKLYRGLRAKLWCVLNRGPYCL
jgi:hypothetical protein